MKKEYLLSTAIFILVMSLLMNCSPDAKSGFADVHRTFTIKSFKDRKSLKSSKLELGTVLAPLFIFFHDSLLFVVADGLDKNVTVYNAAKNHSPLGSLLPRGTEPEEMLSVSRMDFNSDGTFWAHDLVAGRMKEFKLVMDKDTVYAISRKSVSFVPSMNAFFLYPDKIGSTTQDINPLSRFYVYDIEGNRTEEVGEYPSYEREIPATAMVEVFNGWVSVHPDKTKFLLAYEWTDLLEIYNSDFTLVKRIHGPHLFMPEFELKARGSATVMQRKSDLSKFAYQGLTSNNERIFLLYANGKTVPKGAGDEYFHYNTIVAIDWVGNPQTLYELDHKVISICVDWKRRIIYGLDRIESEIYAFSF